MTFMKIEKAGVCDSAHLQCCRRPVWRQSLIGEEGCVSCKRASERPPAELIRMESRSVLDRLAAAAHSLANAELPFRKLALAFLASCLSISRRWRLITTWQVCPLILPTVSQATEILHR